MSTSSFENGFVSFNKAGYASIVRSMREIKNSQADYMYKVAMDIYSKFGAKTSRNQVIAMCTLDDNDVFSYPKMPTDPKMNITEDSFHYIVHELFRGKSEKMLKPRKSGFPHLTNREQSFEMRANCAYITFNGDNNSIEWMVPEGNGAINCAHADCLSKGLMSLLNSHKWGKDEGGAFHHWHEYMSDGEDMDECQDDRYTEPSHAWGNSEYVSQVKKAPVSKPRYQNAFSGYGRY